MYIPRRYQEQDREKILSFMKANSFAIMVTVQNGLPVASHIPLAVEKDGMGNDVLTGHISKGNNQKASLVNGEKVLCIFPGPHAYISPRWYTELNVPTWNYISVHAYGTLRIIQGEEFKAALSRLVDEHEQYQKQPMKMEELPEKLFNDDFRGIIGFEIKIDELQAAYKLSQNRNEESYHNVIENLERGNAGAKQVADVMQENSSQIFKDKEMPGNDDKR